MRPIARYNITGDSLMAMRCAYDAQGRVEYIGYAIPGQADDAEVWQIARYAYDANGNVVSRTYAGGVADYRYRWTQRATYAPRNNNYNIELVDTTHTIITRTAAGGAEVIPQVILI